MMRFCGALLTALVLLAFAGLRLEAAGFDGAVYVCDSSSDKVLCFVDLNGSGLVELDAPGEITVFYDDSSPGPDLSTPSHLAAGPDGSILLLDGGTLDAVLKLQDFNHDGDANDDGEVSIFYDASQGGPKLSTPNTLLRAADGSYYLSDDGSASRRIVRLKDLNGDGDAWDPDEVKVVYDASALSLPVLEDVESLAIGSNGALLAGDTKLQAVYRMVDGNADGDFLDEGELELFFQGTAELPLTNIDAMAMGADGLYVCDNDSGRILVLSDSNADGDAMDAGESRIWLDSTAALKVSSENDILLVASFGFLVLDNSKDSIVALVDSNGDGDVLDVGEAYRWLVDDGSSLATPSGILLLPRKSDPQQPKFLRGDATGDDKIDISDPVMTLGFLFLGKTLGNCMDALDSDDSGVVNISDPIFLLNYLFTGGSPPPAPFPEAGIDQTADNLNC